MSKKLSSLLCPAISVEHKWPANMLSGEEDEFTNERIYNTLGCYLKKFNNAIISPDSVIYSNGVLVKETLAEIKYSNYYQFRHLAKKIITSKKVFLNRKKKYLFVTDSWSGGHFHWICDVLPKLLCVENLIGEFTLLLPGAPYIKSISEESLLLLNGRFEDIIYMENDSLYLAAEVWYVSRVTKSGHMHPGLMSELQTRVSKVRGNNARKIYISRDKATVRKIVNENELSIVIKKYGFEKILAEEMNLKEQIDIFSSCETLMSIHGAGLANCIFMPRGSKVIELRKKEYGPFNVGYWHLADAIGHEYYYFNGIPDSDKPLVGKGCNLTIRISDFEEKILKLI